MVLYMSNWGKSRTQWLQPHLQVEQGPCCRWFVWLATSPGHRTTASSGTGHSEDDKRGLGMLRPCWKWQSIVQKTGVVNFLHPYYGVGKPWVGSLIISDLQKKTLVRVATWGCHLHLVVCSPFRGSRLQANFQNQFCQGKGFCWLIFGDVFCLRVCFWREVSICFLVVASETPPKRDKQRNSNPLHLWFWTVRQVHSLWSPIFNAITNRHFFAKSSGRAEAIL